VGVFASPVTLIAIMYGTDQDGTTNNLVLYIMVPWYRMIHQKGGGRSAGYGLKEKERNRFLFSASLTKI